MATDNPTFNLKHIIAIVGIAVALSGGSGAAIAALIPTVSTTDLERIEERREQRLVAERERADASYADSRDVARLETKINSLTERVGELTMEIRELRGEVSRDRR